MQKLFSGLSGTGKTNKLFSIYQKLAIENGSDKIIYFTSSAKKVNFLRNELELAIGGNLQIYTYFGFALNEVNKWWPVLEKSLIGSKMTVEPTFMNIETSHFLMSNYVEKFRNKQRFFSNLKAKPVQIAVQLIDNLNLTEMNLLTQKEMKKRLLQWVADDKEKKEIMEEALIVMHKFRDFCEKNRLVDYSLALKLFNNNLLNAKFYQNHLAHKFDYLIVDELEKMVPAGQKLVNIMASITKDSWYAYNPAGGFNRFFGGNPALIKKNFLENNNDLEIVLLNKRYLGAEKAADLAEDFAEVINGKKKTASSDLILGEVDSELRGNMVINIGEKITKLIENGTEPEKIAVIAPAVDKVLEFSLEYYLSRVGYKLINYNRSKRLVDLPFARAMLILYLLVIGETTAIGVSALQQTLGLLLDLDPVRSMLLARKMTAEGMQFIDLDTYGLRQRIGFEKGEKYDFLRDWLDSNSSFEFNIEAFFQQVFGEVLAPLKPAPEDIMACRQMIESVSRFRETISNFKDESDQDLSQRYLAMIYEGTLAADVLFNDIEKEDRVLMATPYKFLFAPEIKDVEYLFLVDISSQNWLRSIAKELSNPYLYSPQWNNQSNWNDQADQQIRKNQLLDFLTNLFLKVNKGIYLADSYLDSMGWEQEGPLYNWLKPGQGSGKYAD